MIRLGEEISVFGQLKNLKLNILGLLEKVQQQQSQFANQAEGLHQLSNIVHRQQQQLQQQQQQQQQQFLKIEEGHLHIKNQVEKQQLQLSKGNKKSNLMNPS